MVPSIYVGDYVEEASSAFKDGSFELYEYASKIDPPLKRPEVGLLKEWLAQEALSESSSRLALLYGKAGIGKSVVMRLRVKSVRDDRHTEITV